MLSKCFMLTLLMYAGFCAAGVAQDTIVIPPVPPGLPPLVTWLIGLLASIASVFIPLVAIWFRNYLALQNTQTRAALINGSVTRAAHLADVDMTAQHLTIADAGVGSPVMDKALGYISDSYPDQIKATGQATDDHLAQSVTAEIQRIQNAKAGSAVPSVILSPVSALR